MQKELFIFEGLLLLLTILITSDETTVVSFLHLVERELLDSLPFKIQCSEEEAEIVKGLYETLLKKVS